MPLADHLGSSAYVPGDGLSISEKRGFLGAENFMTVRAAKFEENCYRDLTSSPSF
jgi:hypothetical protein